MNSISLEISSPLSYLPLRIRIMERMKIFFSLVAGKRDVLSQNKERERQFASILNEFGSVISGICFSYSSNSDDLNDLRQDILINLWKGLNGFRGDASLSTWIYRVALNTCVSTIRKRSKTISTISIDNMIEPAEDTDPASRENIEQLHSLIASLSPLDKGIVTMWLDERSYEEIAEVTGISRNNVAVRINRIKKKLADKFKGYDN